MTTLAMHAPAYGPWIDSAGQWCWAGDRWWAVTGGPRRCPWVFLNGKGLKSLRELVAEKDPIAKEVIDSAPPEVAVYWDSVWAPKEVS